MINKLKPKSEFSKNVLTLMTGTTIAQAIPIAVSPILTRLYTPEEFGIFALFVAIVSIFSTVINARYELAIMLPKSDKEAINIFILGFIINITISICLFFIVLLFHDYLIMLLGNEQISIWLYFVPFVVFLTGVFKLLTYFNIRLEHYDDISKSKVIKSAVTAFVQISVVVFLKGVIGLISGSIISSLFSNLKLFLNIIKLKLFKQVSIKKMRLYAYKYKNFPIYSTPATLCDVSAVQMPYIFLNKMYSEQIVGFYFLAVKIIFLPASLISASISQVYLKEITKRTAAKLPVTSLFYSVVKKLFLVSIFFTIIFYFFSPILFSIFFGSNWYNAGEIASTLSIVFFIRFIVSPLSSILTINQFVKRGSQWQFLYFVSILFLFLYGYFNNIEFNEFIIYYIIVEVILYIYYFYIIFDSIKEFDIQLVRR